MDKQLHLHDFLSWVRYRCTRDKDSRVSEKTLECVAQLVEQVLEAKKNPLPKQLGRETDPTRCGCASTWLVLFLIG